MLRPSTDGLRLALQNGLMTAEHVPVSHDVDTATAVPVRAALHVLIAEPDRHRQLACAAILEGAGYRVTGVADAEAALAETAVEQPDLIIVQLAGPHADGLDLCRQVRTGDTTRDLPVIALTTHDDPYIREQVVRSGGTAILAEPLKRTALLRQVRRLLARSRPRGL